MDRILIHRQIVVKSRVTANLKKIMALEVQEKMRRVDSQLLYLDQESHRLSGGALQTREGQGALERLESEHRKLTEARQSLLDNLREIGRLKDGDEVVRGSVTGPAEVGIGDNWARVVTAEVVLEDNKVVEIRDGNGTVEVSR